MMRGYRCSKYFSFISEKPMTLLPFFSTIGAGSRTAASRQASVGDETYPGFGGIRKIRSLFTRSIRDRSEEHTSELQSRLHLVCRLLLEKKNMINPTLTASSRSQLHMC